MPYVREDDHFGNSRWRRISEDDQDAILSVELDEDIVWVESEEEIRAHVEQEYVTDHPCLTIVDTDHNGRCFVRNTPKVRRGTDVQTVCEAAREFDSVEWDEFPRDLGEWDGGECVWGEFIFVGCPNNHGPNSTATGRLYFDPSGAEKILKKRRHRKRKKLLQDGLSFHNFVALRSNIWKAVRRHHLLWNVSMDCSGSGLSADDVAYSTIRTLLLGKQMHGGWSFLDPPEEPNYAHPTNSLWQQLEVLAELLTATVAVGKTRHIQWVAAFFRALWVKHRGVEAVENKPESKTEMLKRLVFQEKLRAKQKA